MKKIPLKPIRLTAKDDQLSAIWSFRRWIVEDFIKKTVVTDWIMVAATVVIACFAHLQYREMHEGGMDTHKLAEAALVANRAWVHPGVMVLDSSVECGLPLKYQIRIINTGKEPALGVEDKLEATGAPYISDGQAETATAGIVPNETCLGLAPNRSAGMVIYPATEYTLPLDIPNTAANLKLINAVLNRNESLVISGCFAYITDGETHTSAFRYFLRDTPGKRSFAISKDGKVVRNWNFNASLNGNNAN
jgi:hypothetical protein